MSDHDRVMLVDHLGQPLITVPFQFDDTDKLAVSLYAKASAVGDTSLVAHATRGLQVALNSVAAAGSDNSAGIAWKTANLSGTSLVQDIRNNLFNGTTWDRERSNEEATLLASAARTVQTDSAYQINYNHKGMLLFVDVTIDPAAAAITPTIRVVDPVSGTQKTIWTAAAPIAAVGVFVYVFHPGAVDIASYTEQVETIIPRTWTLKMTVADADSMTYSVGNCYI